MHRLVFSLVTLIAVVSSSAQAASDGLVRVRSSYDVKTTMDRLEGVLRAKHLKVFLRVDHARGAHDVGMKLRPTELLIFGNPKIGTPLMQCAQSVAIDLPQKALAWEDAEGRVWLAYNDPAYLAKRHRIPGCKKVLGKITGALAKFGKAATSAMQ